VLELDPEQPIYSVATMDDLVVDSIGSRRALRSLLLAVSGVALLISCIGVYGVTAQSVRGRRYEMGIRRVLGADGAGLLGATILTESRGIAVGALLGLAAAVGATRTLQAFLFEVSPLDPVTLLLSVVAVCGVALLAVLGPAWRAVATDPTCSLAANE
jgi:ABC-type antimicrobial peptide transport system permease subunit